MKIIDYFMDCPSWGSSHVFLRWGSGYVFWWEISQKWCSLLLLVSSYPQFWFVSCVGVPQTIRERHRKDSQDSACIVRPTAKTPYRERWQRIAAEQKARGASKKSSVQWSHTRHTELLQHWILTWGIVVSPEAHDTLGVQGFKLRAGQMGTLCLACTKIPDSQKESSVQYKPYCLQRQFRPSELLFSLRECGNHSEIKVPRHQAVVNIASKVFWGWQPRACLW